MIGDGIISLRIATRLLQTLASASIFRGMQVIPDTCNAPASDWHGSSKHGFPIFAGCKKKRWVMNSWLL